MQLTASHQEIMPFIEPRASSAAKGTDVLAPARELTLGIIGHYHQSLLGPNRNGLDYLATRGLTDMAMLAHFRVGYVDGSLKAKLGSVQIQQAREIGFFMDKEEAFIGRIIIPVFDDGNALSGIEAWDPKGKSGHQYLDLSGNGWSVWNGAAAMAYPDELILTEGAFDGLALWQAGIKNVTVICGKQVTESTYSAFAEQHSLRKIVLAFQNGETGEQAAKKIAPSMTTLGIKAHQLRWPNGIKGAHEYFHGNQKGTAQTFTTLLANAPRIGFIPEKGKNLVLTEKTEDTAIFQGETVTYRVKGIGLDDSMRVVLTAKTARAQHVDHLDLYASRARKQFSNSAAERLELDASSIEKDLLGLLELIEQCKHEAATAPVTTVAAMTADDEKEARLFLKSPNLLDRIAVDLEAVGYVGEMRGKKLAYLVATSRKLPTPLSAIIRSQSSTGKSHLMKCVGQMMPPEDVHDFSRLTSQALYYLEKDALVHKFLVVDERDGSEEAEYSIRTLQTSRILKLAVPTRDSSSKKMKTEVIEIHGPIAFMESTTDAHINPENANRCFEIYLDESEKQTQAILAEQRRSRTLDGWKQERQRAVVLRVHHHAQRLLRPLKVIIPYVDLIRLPASWLRVRRDNDRFLALIEGLALLHQFQRTIAMDGNIEYIVAGIEDYGHAYDLAHQVFANTTADLPKPVADFLGQVEGIVKKLATKNGEAPEAVAFSRRDIREELKFPPHIVKRYLRELEDLEYLVVKRAPRGSSSLYRLATHAERPRQLEGLLTPQELAEKWDKWNKSGTGQKSKLTNE